MKPGAYGDVDSAVSVERRGVVRGQERVVGTGEGRERSGLRSVEINGSWRSVEDFVPLRWYFLARAPKEGELAHICWFGVASQATENPSRHHSGQGAILALRGHGGQADLAAVLLTSSRAQTAEATPLPICPLLKRNYVGIRGQ